MTLVDYGQIKVTNGQQGSRSNSTKLYTIPGAPCRAAANGKKPKSTYRYRKPRTVCPYSASCFTCPLPDCRMGSIAVNKLPEGFVFRFDD